MAPVFNITLPCPIEITDRICKEASWVSTFVELFDDVVVFCCVTLVLIFDAGTGLVFEAFDFVETGMRFTGMDNSSPLIQTF